MRIRDIRTTGYYGRRAPERDHVNREGQADDTLALESVHVIGVVPMCVTALARLWCLPLIEGRNGDVEMMTADLFFSKEDDWRFLCDGSEADFGPHTFLMRLMQLAGYSEDDAREMARDTLVRDLERRIYGSAETDR